MVRLCGSISNRPDAAGLATASDAGVATTLVDHTLYESRRPLTQRLQRRSSKTIPMWSFSPASCASSRRYSSMPLWKAGERSPISVA